MSQMLLVQIFLFCTLLSAIDALPATQTVVVDHDFSTHRPLGPVTKFLNYLSNTFFGVRNANIERVVHVEKNYNLGNETKITNSTSGNETNSSQEQFEQTAETYNLPMIDLQPLDNNKNNTFKKFNSSKLVNVDDSNKLKMSLYHNNMKLNHIELSKNNFVTEVPLISPVYMSKLKSSKNQLINKSDIIKQIRKLKKSEKNINATRFVGSNAENSRNYLDYNELISSLTDYDSEYNTTKNSENNADNYDYEIISDKEENQAVTKKDDKSALKGSIEINNSTQTKKLEREAGSKSSEKLDKSEETEVRNSNNEESKETAERKNNTNSEYTFTTKIKQSKEDDKSNTDIKKSNESNKTVEISENNNGGGDKRNMISKPIETVENLSENLKNKNKGKTSKNDKNYETKNINEKTVRNETKYSKEQSQNLEVDSNGKKEDQASGDQDGQETQENDETEEKENIPKEEEKVGEQEDSNENNDKQKEDYEDGDNRDSGGGEQTGAGFLGTLIQGFLGTLSTPEGTLDADALLGIISSFSKPKADGTYDFTGITETLTGFFGGAAEGGSDVAAFVGGLLAAVIRGFANPPGPRGVGLFAGKILGEVFPALIGPPLPAEGEQPQNLNPKLGSAQFVKSLLQAFVSTSSKSSGGSGSGSGSGSKGHKGPEGNKTTSLLHEVKYSFLRLIFALIASIFTTSSRN